MYATNKMISWRFCINRVAMARLRKLTCVFLKFVFSSLSPCVWSQSKNIKAQVVISAETPLIHNCSIVLSLSSVCIFTLHLCILHFFPICYNLVITLWRFSLFRAFSLVYTNAVWNRNILARLFLRCCGFSSWDGYPLVGRLHFT
jgi:hypothetical protein